MNLEILSNGKKFKIYVLQCLVSSSTILFYSILIGIILLWKIQLFSNLSTYIIIFSCISLTISILFILLKKKTIQEFISNTEYSKNTYKLILKTLTKHIIGFICTYSLLDPQINISIKIIISFTALLFFIWDVIIRLKSQTYITIYDFFIKK